jgi:hypothetical protein
MFDKYFIILVHGMQIFNSLEEQMNKLLSTTRFTITILLISLGALLLSSCETATDESPEPPQPVSIESIEQIVGDWQRAKPHGGVGVTYLRFNSDGTYRQATGSQDRLETPMFEGTFELNSGEIVVTDYNQLIEHYLWECDSAADAGRYSVSLMENGSLLIERITDECVSRQDNFPAEYISLP